MEVAIARFRRVREFAMGGLFCLGGVLVLESVERIGSLVQTWWDIIIFMINDCAKRNSGRIQSSTMCGAEKNLTGVVVILFPVGDRFAHDLPTTQGASRSVPTSTAVVSRNWPRPTINSPLSVGGGPSLITDASELVLSPAIPKVARPQFTRRLPRLVKKLLYRGSKSHSTEIWKLGQSKAHELRIARGCAAVPPAEDCIGPILESRGSPT
ncbi:hypothetical protein B0H19DRAFT_121353 [Mycena capillaripes]|nr:hypothetical protein B0H19DRAFT_121353 [Mycena capillaripes]